MNEHREGVNPSSCVIVPLNLEFLDQYRIPVNLCLKQAPRAWYERLSKFLIENGYNRGKVDTTLFIKVKGHDILVVQIYVDHIIFSATNESPCQEFSKVMQGEFEMNVMGELTFFLGLQVKQTKAVIFINQAKYVKDLLKSLDWKPQSLTQH